MLSSVVLHVVLSVVVWTNSASAQGTLDYAVPIKLDEKFARMASVGIDEKGMFEVHRMIAARHTLCARDPKSCSNDEKWIKGVCAARASLNAEAARSGVSAWIRGVTGTMAKPEYKAVVAQFFKLCSPETKGANIFAQEVFARLSRENWPDATEEAVDSIIEKSKSGPAATAGAAEILLGHYDAFRNPERKPNRKIRDFLIVVINSPAVTSKHLFQAAHYSFYRYADVQKVFAALESKRELIAGAPVDQKIELVKLYCHATRFLMKPGLCQGRSKAWNMGNSILEGDTLREGEAAERMAIGDSTNAAEIKKILRAPDAGCVEPVPWRMFYLQQHYRAVGKLDQADECLLGLRKNKSAVLTILFDQEHMRNLLSRGMKSEAKVIRDNLSQRGETLFGSGSLTETMLFLDALKVAAVDQDKVVFAKLKKQIADGLSDGRALPIWSRQIVEIESRLLNNKDSEPDAVFQQLAKSETFMEIRNLQAKYKTSLPK